MILAGVAGACVGVASTAVLRGARAEWRPTGAAPMTAAGWAAVSLLGGTASVAVLAWWCACLSSIDVGSRRLPNVLTAAGAIVIGVHAAVLDRFPAMLVGAAGLFGCYLVVHVVMPRAFGAGDVKLAWPLGGVAAMAGIDAWAVAALAAPLLTGVAGVIVAACGRRRARVPHGPAMCLSTLLALAA